MDSKHSQHPEFFPTSHYTTQAISGHGGFRIIWTDLVLWSQNNAFCEKLSKASEHYLGECEVTKQQNEDFNAIIRGDGTRHKK